MWNMGFAVQHLDDNAAGSSSSNCAKFVREAIEAGGVQLMRTNSAKDYGSILEQAMFRALPNSSGPYIAGDVAVIQPIAGHPHGHMAMFDGEIWVSDFKQNYGFYPSSMYRKLKPSVTVYRYLFILVAPPPSDALSEPAAAA